MENRDWIFAYTAEVNGRYIGIRIIEVYNMRRNEAIKHCTLKVWDIYGITANIIDWSLVSLDR